MKKMEMIARFYEKTWTWKRNSTKPKRQVTKRAWKPAERVTRNCFRRFGPMGKTSAA